MFMSRFMRPRALPLMSALLLTLFASEAAHAYSHQYINMSRSSQGRYIFVTQSFEGEFGQYTSKGERGTVSKTWQGYGIQNGVGMEIMKFVQFGVSHTQVNNRAKGDAGQRILGSRLAGDMKLVFSAPVGNLEAGFGMLASRLDYQSGLEQASLLGSGMYYSLGVNYFLSGNVSFFGQARQYAENLVYNSGSADISSIQTDSRSIGFGFSVWL